LAELTVEEGSVIQAADGAEIAIYVDVDMDNTMTEYDVTTGTQVAELTAGTYENVVIVVG
ncbi:MAG: hypothetical protein LUE21_08380, partial [Oscillospiraceae bacterium]|nr:hypothetical protein [Oscillospiraceae bacterium]